MGSVNNTVALELDPHAVCPRSGEGQTEANVGTAFRHEWMRVEHPSE
jgi:hypothetical protein